MARGEGINPEILIWARESAGLSIADAADKIGLLPSETASASDKLIEFETGVKSPTRNQLVKIAAVYRRPLITFYMAVPPPKGERGEDFRAHSVGISNRENALLDALLRDIRGRQEMVRSLLEDEDEAVRLQFVGAASISDGVHSVARRINDALGLPETGQGRPGGPDSLFKDLRSRCEHLGVFVLLVGNLGSHHSALTDSVFRGFALADEVAPFIVINDQDARAARAFTLIHELTHIWIGQSGVSGSAEDDADPTPKGRIEQFCNDVASEVLLPSAALAERPSGLAVGGKEGAHRVIGRIADTWSVSEPMVAYRFHRMGWISSVTYRQLSADYAARWRANKAQEKAKTKENEGGPSYYVIKQHKLGNALIGIVQRTLRDNLLTHTKAAKVLGVKPTAVEPLLRRFEAGRGAIFIETRR
ncbi:DNA-binding protein [Niveispirillum lacus]|uniref:DNA-binding protein n=1 Tax=Niveispirillum lacus TaxID=1981099 RepID=A0A255Z4Z5_9PROT|nr:XRE family transcriptional regulator [Niveispirillum lacus]OYQ36519.1 DNA-binding protein [Niveispirillum lacus]